MLIQALEVEKKFEDTHSMKNWLLSVNTHLMDNYQIVMKNSIIDEADKVRNSWNTDIISCNMLSFLKKALD